MVPLADERQWVTAAAMPAAEFSPAPALQVDGTHLKDAIDRFTATGNYGFTNRKNILLVVGLMMICLVPFTTLTVLVLNTQFVVPSDACCSST